MTSTHAWTPERILADEFDLTPTEAGILATLASGFHYHRPETLGPSTGAVKVHIHRIREKTPFTIETVVRAGYRLSRSSYLCAHGLLWPEGVAA